jgi:hypothetical protein
VAGRHTIFVEFTSLTNRESAFNELSALKHLRHYFSGGCWGMKENSDRQSETVPVVDIAAEATNEGSPAQSIPETIPPRARANVEKPNKPLSSPSKRSEQSGADRKS